MGLLATHFNSVVLMLDGDEAGRHGAMSIAQTLAARMSVSVISLEDGHQPDQLAPEEIQHLLTSTSWEDVRCAERTHDPRQWRGSHIGDQALQDSEAQTWRIEWNERCPLWPERANAQGRT